MIVFLPLPDETIILSDLSTEIIDLHDAAAWKMLAAAYSP
jgi:hypothetical protein